jgi:hypothetical protein
MKAMKPAHGHPVPDRAAPKPERPELPHGHDSLLTIRQLREPAVT